MNNCADQTGRALDVASSALSPRHGSGGRAQRGRLEIGRISSVKVYWFLRSGRRAGAQIVDNFIRLVPADIFVARLRDFAFASVTEGECHMATQCADATLAELASGSNIRIGGISWFFRTFSQEIAGEDVVRRRNSDWSCCDRHFSFSPPPLASLEEGDDSVNTPAPKRGDRTLPPRHRRTQK